MSEPKWDTSVCQHNGQPASTNGLWSQPNTRPIYYLQLGLFPSFLELPGLCDEHSKWRIDVQVFLFVASYKEIFSDV